MGKKIRVTVSGRTKTLAEWARELGISRQRANQLHHQGRLIQYINGERRGSGRPPKQDLYDRLAEVEDLNIFEAAEKLNVSPGVVFNYRKNVESSRENR